MLLQITHASCLCLIGPCLQVPHMVVEYLQWLILVFGPQWDWNVDWSNA